MEAKYDVFISYSRKDKKWVDRFIYDLKEHDINPWVDTLEIGVGDAFREKIESGIIKSKYFCLVISKNSMNSFYVRKVEMEAAFSRIIKSKNEPYILPILLEHPENDFPLMLQKYHYLDFTKKRNYLSNISSLVRRIKLDSTNFSGTLWHKGLDVSGLGVFVGIGRLPKKSHNGYSVEITYDDGIAKTLNMYTDGQLYCTKHIYYRDGRVAKIEQYKKGLRTERLLYFYSGAGRRLKKQWFGSNDYPYMEANWVSA